MAERAVPSSPSRGRLPSPLSSWTMARPRVAACAAAEVVPAEEQACSFSTAEQTSCRFERDAQGLPRRICERKRQLLRHCMGRPTEVIESSSEQIEDNKMDGRFFGFESHEMPRDRERNSSDVPRLLDDEWFRTFGNRLPNSREGANRESPIFRFWDASEHMLRDLFKKGEQVDEGLRGIVSEVEDFVRSAEGLAQEFFGQTEKGEDRAGVDGSGGLFSSDRKAEDRKDDPRYFWRLWRKPEVSSEYGGGRNGSKSSVYSDFSRSFEEV